MSYKPVSVHRYFWDVLIENPFQVVPEHLSQVKRRAFEIVIETHARAILQSKEERIHPACYQPSV